MATKTMKKWILTDTFDFYSKEAHYWEFDDFMDAKETGQSLVNSIGTNYLWRSTKGNPIKWIKFG